MGSNEKFIKNWEETRKRGRLRYALGEGSIFGFLISFIFIIVAALSKSADEYISLNYIYFIGLSVLGGIIGYWLIFWPMNEYFYKKTS